MPCGKPPQIVNENDIIVKKVFIAKKFELPFFIGNFIQSKYAKKILHNQLLKYDKTECYAQYHREHVQPPKTLLPFSVVPRFNQRDYKLTPAANRYELSQYDLANLIKKQTGTKGPFMCFTGERNDSSLIGHKAPPRGEGSKTMFYSIPTGMDILNHPKRYFILKFREGSRFKQKTGIRIILNDIACCPKDPLAPGPAEYYPQNWSIKKVPASKIKRKEPLVFYPASCVPESERFIIFRPFLPGPGRYTIDELACPCPSGSKYESDLGRSIILFAHKKGKQQKYKRGQCPSGRMRNIPYHGCTWLFKSRVMRLVSKMKKAAKLSRVNRPMEHDLKYISMIQNPHRKALSTPVRVPFNKNPNIQFNTINRPLRRSKLRNNKRVAFMSSTPRFKEITKLSKSQFVKKRSPNIIIYEPFIPDLSKRGETALERLQRLPPRLEKLKPKNETSDKVYTFQPLPQAKILVKDFEAIPKEKLELINAKFNVEAICKVKGGGGGYKSGPSEETTEAVPQ